ncbi:MAG TPA: flagellar hook assembly protein FlgD [Gammaproteobacteria bacterium]|jgi:flagellar basal-body rod modification protein FlgD|nr:flagellar hook assembly protein FlgD [Gammaproteobacteria bacterium]
MVDAVTGTDYGKLGLGVPQTTTKKTDLGQEDFLHLMLTQLKNQDPFKPLDSSEFLGQLAQFGTVSGLSQLQTSFDSLKTSLVSNQALQAASLVGRSAVVESSTMGIVDGQPVLGAVDLPASTSSLTVTVLDSTGQVVRTIPLGAHGAGQAQFVWDGMTDGGGTAPAGQYTFNAAYRNGSKTEAGTTLLAAPIDSVKLDSNGFSVALRGIGDIPFSSVREIMDNIYGN